MSIKKIGEYDWRDQPLHDARYEEAASLKEIILSMRQELDNLYTKLNSSSIAEEDFGTDDITPCKPLFTEEGE